VPRAWTPTFTFDKILFEGQSVVPYDRFTNTNETGVSLTWDNGKSGDNSYIVKLQTPDGETSFPNQWSESGRNDAEADLMEELQEMVENIDARITVDSSTPPGV